MNLELGSPRSLTPSGQSKIPYFLNRQSDGKYCATLSLEELQPLLRMMEWHIKKAIQELIFDPLRDKPFVSQVSPLQAESKNDYEAKAIIVTRNHCLQMGLNIVTWLVARLQEEVFDLLDTQNPNAEIQLKDILVAIEKESRESTEGEVLGELILSDSELHSLAHQLLEAIISQIEALAIARLETPEGSDLLNEYNVKFILSINRVWRKLSRKYWSFVFKTILVRFKNFF